MKKILNSFRTNGLLKNVVLWVGILFFVLSCALIGSQIGNFRVSNVTTVYSAKASKLVLTKVKFKNNDIFQNDADGYYVSNGGFYVASLLDKIHIDFYDTLTISSSETSEIRVVKSVTAFLVIESQEGEILQEVKSVERPGFISQVTESYSNESSIVINQDVELDYSEFYLRYSSINASLSGIQCTAYLKINYNVNCSGKINGENFSYNDNLTSCVGVQNSGSVRFENSYTPSSDMKKDTTILVDKANYGAIVFGSIFAIVGLTMLGFSLFVIVQQVSEEKNKKYIRKIISRFSDIIVESKTDLLSDKKLKKIVVEDFDDLLKVEAELSKPIILNHNENLYNFCVIGEDILYAWSFDENGEMQEQEDGDK